MSGTYYFANRYRINSNRMKGYNYKSGRFFVTICTKDRECYFGYVENQKMILNEIGNVANQCLIDIVNYFPDVTIDKFVVMPNHVHMILVVNDYENVPININVRDAINRVSTTPPTANTTPPTANTTPPTANTIQPLINIKGGITGNYNPMLCKNSLGNIIRSYKSVCKYIINKSNLGSFHRQPNYYDHIIKDNNALNTIRMYIQNNPKNWNRDRNINQNLYI